MIVLKRDGRLVLIRQVDHSALSGEFTRRWGNDRFERPQPLESVALASALHDEGWRGPDEEPLYDPRRKEPLHWRNIEVPEHVVLYGEGIRRVIARDPYAGLLASMHGAGIYTRRYGTFQVKMTTIRDDVRSVMEAFVAEQEAAQAALKRAVWSPAQRRSEFERRLWAQYDVMQIWDRLSLFACLNDLAHPAEDRLGPMPVTTDGPVVDLLVQARGGGLIELAPYPFDVSTLDVTVPARVIPDRPYETAEDLRAAMRQASDAPIRCRFTPAGGADRRAPA
jgi:hypothetical protein